MSIILLNLKKGIQTILKNFPSRLKPDTVVRKKKKKRNVFEIYKISFISIILYDEGKKLQTLTNKQINIFLQLNHKLRNKQKQQKTKRIFRGIL